MESEAKPRSNYNGLFPALQSNEKRAAMSKLAHIERNIGSRRSLNFPSVVRLVPDSASFALIREDSGKSGKRRKSSRGEYATEKKRKKLIDPTFIMITRTFITTSSQGGRNRNTLHRESVLRGTPEIELEAFLSSDPRSSREFAFVKFDLEIYSSVSHQDLHRCCIIL